MLDTFKITTFAASKLLVFQLNLNDISPIDENCMKDLIEAKKNKKTASFEKTSIIKATISKKLVSIELKSELIEKRFLKTRN